MNPLNNFVSHNQNSQTQNNNPMQMIGQFMDFAKNFQGNPEQEIQKLIANGQISQEQLNQMIPMAKQIQGFLSQMGIKL